MNNSLPYFQMPRDYIPYGKQTIGDAERAAVNQVLQSNWLTQGPEVEAFESGLVEYCRNGQPDNDDKLHCFAVSNGSVALHLSCMALGLSSGDILWTSAMSFVASANCGMYCGATVDFIDIDLATRNICIEAFAEKLEAAAKNNTLPKIVVVVHFAGMPCDLKAIKYLAERYNFYIVEDAAHALGSFYQGVAIGGCEFSDISTLSFHPVKSITTGEGGAVFTRNELIAERLLLLRSHGIERSPNNFLYATDCEYYYEQQSLGFNSRMSDIQAAMGNVQLSRLNDFKEKRQYLVDTYQKNFAAGPLKLPSFGDDDDIFWHLYVIEVVDSRHSRDKLFQYLRSEGIGVQVHYIPIHLHPFYRHRYFKEGDFPNAETYYANALTLPLFPTLTQEEQAYVIDKVNEFVCK